MRKMEGEEAPQKSGGDRKEEGTRGRICHLKTTSLPWSCQWSQITFPSCSKGNSEKRTFEKSQGFF